jgi:dihydroflavonol-4-reductase
MARNGGEEASMVETVLVTGGSGYVGGWCIVELLKQGYAVRTTVRGLAKGPAVRAAVATVVDPGDRLSFAVADLTADAGWDEAMAGVAYVLHVASPMGGGAEKDPEALIGPARDGTVRVLKAATRAGVKRVVMTSSCAAVALSRKLKSGTSDETTWTDLGEPGLNAYRRSKVVAERAAWDFMAAQAGPTTLTTVLPSAIFGPVLTRENLGSVGFIKALLNGRPPGLPSLAFCVVDVRDLAQLHVRAMTAPEAAGQRFIAAGTLMSFSEIAALLRGRLGQRAAKVPTGRMPDVVVRLFSLFVPALKSVTPELGRRMAFSSDKARRMLGFSPRPAAQTVIDCAESLLAPG